MYPEYNPIEQMKRQLDQGVGGAFSLNEDPEEDKALNVTFILEPRPNAKQSKEAGRLICDEIEICEIRLPGTTDKIRNEVTDRERQRFPSTYAAFRKTIEAGGREQQNVQGTPLKLWPMITAHPGLIEEAHYKGFRTVEHVAEMPDGVVKGMGIGWVDLRNKARTWLKAAKDGAVLSRMADDKAEMERRIATLEGMVQRQAEEIAASRTQSAPVASAGPDPIVAKLAAQVEALSAALKPVTPTARPRGRPKKLVDAIGKVLPDRS